MKETVFLDELWEVIGDRAAHPSSGSYVSGILTHPKGIDRALEKVGEECVEFILAMKNESETRKIEEAADLLFHLLVALRAGNIELSEVVQELSRRRR
jgi:phosphoribosyl-ATP pyrophosphohydrolase